MVVTFVDGTWTDNLSITRYSLQHQREGLVLAMEVVPREARGKVRIARQALATLVEKRLSIHTIQIGKPRFTSRLRERMRKLGCARLGLRLSAKGMVEGVSYPAGVVFNPDSITLNLG